MHNLLDQLLQAAQHWPNETKDQLADASPWRKLVDALLEDSLKANATQVHLQSMRRESFVRYCIDGQLVNRAEFEHGIHENLAISLKRFGRIDVCERRRPQASAMNFSLDGVHYYFEMSAVPTTQLPSVVLNWRPPRAVRELTETGLESCQLDALKQLLASGRGWVLNFRSISLGVAMLVAMKECGRRPLRIAAGELYEFPALNGMGIDQRFYERSSDCDYATWAARQLTSDNDCVVVEVGNHLVAELMNATRQGKLICTGFGRSLPHAPEYLEHFGVSRQEFVENIVASVEQFTVPANCTHCAEEYRPSKLEIEALRIRCDCPEQLVFARSRGCTACRNAWPRKLTGVHEVFLAKDVKQLIEDNQPAEVIRAALLANGAIDFYTALVRKVVRRQISSWVAIMQQPYLFRTPIDRERWIEI